MSSIAGLLDLLTSKMSYLNQKQAVLSENVANSDTPGYKQLEIMPFSFGDALKQAQGGGSGMNMAVTDPRHITPGKLAGANVATTKSKDTEVMANGNSVDVEGQMMEVSRTSMDYQTVASIYHKMTGLFKIAAKGSSS